MNDAGTSGRRAAPSLRDVARMAGVSPASVSRVLNGVSPTSERLRQRVDAAVKKAGYVPRNLKLPGTGETLVVVTSDLLNPYFNEIITGIEDRASTFGLTPFLVDLQRGHAPWESIRAAVSGLRPRGYIVLGGALEEASIAEFADQARAPVVVVNQAIRHASVRTINIDYVQATYAATVHLLKLGHRQIAFLGGNPSSPVSIEKVRGMEAAMTEANLTLPTKNIVFGIATVDWGFQAMNSLLEQPGESRPTAVLCACDLIALGVLHAVRSSEFSVPDDVSVVGFDDIDMACHANPPLTTIAPPKYAMGLRAAYLLVPHSGEVSQITEYVMIESPLVVRESTTVCRASGPGKSAR
jgi:DNA-binding LacI/PurR family transcriptional regulator